ncbi:hypothetical protein F4808DRAFT_474518 [Astrocystis sublimbata]|nr:hypothetical protein F4808DRAFT_474518 [Astrocystis sublimbata]
MSAHPSTTNNETDPDPDPWTLSLSPWYTALTLSLSVYVLLCTLVRRGQDVRRQALGRRYGFTDRASSSSSERKEGMEVKGVKMMTLDEAYEIKCRVAEEFEGVFGAAVGSVFFKAEAIPTIATLIAHATRRSTPRPPRVRGPGNHPLALLSRPGSRENNAAIDRVNKIHAHYRPDDDDLLYVLALFALEPRRWIARFEGRTLERWEVGALAVLWRRVGGELGVRDEVLKGVGYVGSSSFSSSTFLDNEGNEGGRGIGKLQQAEKEKQRRKGEGEGGNDKGRDEGADLMDALLWLEALEKWARDYEVKKRPVTPTAESVLLGERQMDAWTNRFPTKPLDLRRVARGFYAAALVEPRQRRAMGIEEPPTLTVFVVEGVIRVRKSMRRYMCSPQGLAKGVYALLTEAVA